MRTAFPRRSPLQLRYESNRNVESHRRASQSLDMIVVGGEPPRRCRHRWGVARLRCAAARAERLRQRYSKSQHQAGARRRAHLEQGNIGLVMEALKERGLLLQNAPHLVRDLAFIVPNYDWWEAPFYGLGLKLYQLLAGQIRLWNVTHPFKRRDPEHLPTLKTDGLRARRCLLR